MKCDELKSRRAYFSEDEYDKGAHKICAKVSDCGYDKRNDWWSYAFEDEVYLKSEADKVIAEKDKEIDKLKESIGKLLKSKTEQIMDEVLEKVIIYGEGFVPVEHAMKLVAELRHYKYKWLLAKAELCDADACYQEMYIMDDKKATWFFNWEYKWRKLAEKFKEEK